MCIKNLPADTGISSFIASKTSKCKPVSREVMLKFCKALNCDISDIVEAVPVKTDNLSKDKEQI
jgi:DNA-binding Xre family transcriptional regulator